jgi:hypothetical protein
MQGTCLSLNALARIDIPVLIFQEFHRTTVTCPVARRAGEAAGRSVAATVSRAARTGVHRDS